MDERFLRHTAAMIVSVAAASNMGDPQAIAEHALAMALDIDVDGLDEPAGPDYPRELETADEAAAELDEIEAES